jgi:hypothetical protein
MRPSHFSAFVVVSAVLGAPSMASAAAPWSAPQSVPGSQDASPFTVGLSLGRSTERGVIGFSINPHPELFGSPQSGAVAGFALGSPSPAQPLGSYDLGAPPVAYGEGRAIVAQKRFIHRGPGIHRLAVSLASSPADLGERKVLDDRVRLRDVALAANGDGRAAIAWTEDRGYSGRRANNDRLYVSLRPVRGQFGKPSVVVGSGKLGNVSIAVGTNGHVVVAFERQAIDRSGKPGPRRVQARYRGTRGHGFEPIDDLGVERGVTDLVTQVASDGRAFVAWGTQDGGIEANDPFEVYAATKPRTFSRFHAAVQLFRGRGRSVDRPRGHLSLALDRAGAYAVLAFTGVADGGPAIGTLQPVLVSTTNRSGTFGLPVLVPGANGAVGGIVAQPGGESTVVWTGLKPGFAEEATGVLASTRPAGAGALFPATPEVVSATPPPPTSIASLALPLAGGVPVAAWYEQHATGVLTSRRG